jgi:hypothetical protein
VLVPLVIQHAQRMRRMILSSVACLAVPYFFFSVYLINGTSFGGGGKFLERKICVLIFCTTLSKTFFILRRIQRNIVINVL